MLESVPEIIQAIVLGIVQGATEFIPVSSSGHLVLVPFVLGWEKPSLAFDVALHAGTAGAIVVYFRRDLLAMAGAIVRPDGSPESATYRRLVVYLALATVPAGLIGVAFRSTFEGAFATPRLASALLLVTAAMLVGGERLRARRIARTPASAPVPASRPAMTTSVGADPEDPAGTTLDRVDLRQAMAIGLGQALALLPGISRSGSTITTGLAMGLTRAAATRFSFLLALPVLVGAAVVSVPDLAEPGRFSGADIVAGVLAAFVSGYLAVAFLVRLVARAGLTGFALYLVAASGATMALTFVR
ncbi:MAG TPA: undecaprenyl-diphosphate phosphatase [Acidimicrobiales bacterium]|nr:undecaprenyl-diphosphate phosphatase [Acidimicrobiales bacterium]